MSLTLRCLDSGGPLSACTPRVIATRRGGFIHVQQALSGARRSGGPRDFQVTPAPPPPPPPPHTTRHPPRPRFEASWFSPAFFFEVYQRQMRLCCRESRELRGRVLHAPLASFTAGWLVGGTGKDTGVGARIPMLLVVCTLPVPSPSPDRPGDGRSVSWRRTKCHLPLPAHPYHPRCAHPGWCGRRGSLCVVWRF